MNFKDLRKNKNYRTQKDLANMLNIEKSTISKWEAGNFPTVDKLLELTILFNESSDVILNAIKLSKKTTINSPARHEIDSGND